MVYNPFSKFLSAVEYWVWATHSFIEWWIAAKSNLFILAENDGFAVLIFPLLIFIKKMADTTYCGPPFFQVLRYLYLSQSKTMNLGAMLITEKFALQNFTISCHDL